MKNYPKRIKNTLHSVIRDMAKHPEDFCRCPEKNFTRKRKLPFEKVLTLLVKMGGHSLRDEMLDCLDFKETPASVSALVQQRSKLLPEALEYLFREFTNRCHNPKLYKGYRLLAVVLVISLTVLFTKLKKASDTMMAPGVSVSMYAVREASEYPIL